MSTHVQREAKRAIARGERPRIDVTRDDDGGITAYDPFSGVVLSVISTHPLASGPRGLIVEAYAYQSGQKMEAQDWPRKTLVNDRCLVRTYYVKPDGA